MQNKTFYKGVALVATAAICYGMVATVVKLAYKNGHTTAEVTSAQYLLGILGTFIIALFRNKSQKTEISSKNKLSLLAAGTSMGFTSLFYYLSVQYIPVSIAIVLLMQTIWMGVFLEFILDKKTPSIQKTISVLLALFGTILATNAYQNLHLLNPIGILFGIMAAIGYTTSMYASNRVATQIHSVQRTFFMLIGGAIIIIIYAFFAQNKPFQFDIFYTYGPIIALLGTIITPILMNAGFPSTGIGVGSIISSLELPISVFMAFIILHENVIFTQWLGITIILIAVIFLNINFKKQ